MAKMNLGAFLKVSKLTNFTFTGLEQKLDQDGNKYVIVTLDNPIETVTGSQTVVADGETVRVIANDVTQVSIRAEYLEDEGISYDPDTKKGEVNTDLMLDVAKRSLEVWLTRESFQSFGQKQRSTRTAANNQGLAARIAANRAKKEFPDGVVDTALATNTEAKANVTADALEA